MSTELSASPDGAGRWTASTVAMNSQILDRMEQAVAKVRERLLRAAAALGAAGIRFAVVGGNAVGSWVATVDEGAVRNTRDIDLLVARADLPAISAALEQAGFVPGEVLGVHVFRDGPEGKPSEAVHLIFAGEKARPEYVLPTPQIEATQAAEQFPVLALLPLVVMKLTSNRDKDRTHIRDLIGVGLIDATWPEKLPGPLGERLQQILDTPHA